MAFGDSPCDNALDEAWGAFCDSLKAAGKKVFKDYNPATPLHRADGFRFLTQNLGQAFDLALETKNTRYPALHPFCTPSRKLGGDAADFVYLQAWIDGESVYRISGNKGSARFLNFTVQGHRPDKQPGTDIPSLHDPFGDIPQANLFGHELESHWDGSFELYIGGEKTGPNWLPSTPETRKLFIRQGFDRWEEQPAKLQIERVGMDEPRPAPTPDEVIEAMNWAGRFVEGVMGDWPDHPYLYSPAVDAVNTNTFPPEPPSVDSADQRRGRAIANLCWAVKEDEVLIVEFDSHDGFWMMSNMGAFFSSLDYLYRPVSYTPSRTKIDSDGKIRLILCKDDPGYHNWLDTQGYERGSLTYRNLLGTQPTQFRTELVKYGDLARVLPEESAKISAAERVQQMHQRFDGIRQRYVF